MVLCIVVQEEGAPSTFSEERGNPSTMPEHLPAGMASEYRSGQGYPQNHHTSNSFGQSCSFPEGSYKSSGTKPVDNNVHELRKTEEALKKLELKKGIKSTLINSINDTIQSIEDSTVIKVVPYQVDKVGLSITDFPTLYNNIFSHNAILKVDQEKFKKEVKQYRDLLEKTVELQELDQSIKELKQYECSLEELLTDVKKSSNELDSLRPWIEKMIGTSNHNSNTEDVNERTSSVKLKEQDKENTVK